MELALRAVAWLWPGVLELPAWLQVGLGAGLVAAFWLGFISLGPVFYTYAERKIAGFMQDRLGPMRVGPWGVLQSIADTIKLLFKEAIYPSNVDPFLFVLAPCLVVTGAFMPFVVVPLGEGVVAADLHARIAAALAA